MVSKWRRLMCSMPVWVFVNCAFAVLADASATEAPSVCPRPENAVPIQLSQLIGVWHYQAMVTDGPPNNDVACSRIEFVRTSNTSAFVSGSQYYKSTGKSSHSYGPVTVLNSRIIRTESLDIPSTTFDAYPLLLTEDALVYTTCVIRDGQLDSQNVAVLTRSPTVDRKYVQDLLSEVNVSSSNVGYTHNYEECFTLNCHRKSA